MPPGTSLQAWSRAGARWWELRRWGPWQQEPHQVSMPPDTMEPAFRWLTQPRVPEGGGGDFSRSWHSGSLTLSCRELSCPETTLPPWPRKRRSLPGAPPEDIRLCAQGRSFHPKTYKSLLEQGKARAEPGLSARRLRPQWLAEMGAGSAWKGRALVPERGLGVI